MKKTVMKGFMGAFLMLLLLATVSGLGVEIPTTITAQAASPKVTKPSAVKKVTKVKAADKTIIVKWQKVSKSTGYQVRTYKGSKLVKKLSTKNLKATIKGLKANTTYKVKVRAYKKSKGKTLYGKEKAATIKTTKAAAKTPAQKKPTDKEIAATGTFGGTATLEVGYYTSYFKWKNCNGPAVNESKVKWTVSDSSKLKLTIAKNSKNTIVSPEPLKAGTVTITLTYAGYTVGSMKVTINERPAGYSYWEPGCSLDTERYAEIKKFNENINDWIAKNITKDMSQYEKAAAAAKHVRTYMTYDASKVGQDMVKLWNGRKGGVCAHAAGILDCFLRKMQIDTCVGHISRNDHPTNWAMLDGQTYEIDATFWHGAEGTEMSGVMMRCNKSKPDDGTNEWKYPTE